MDRVRDELARQVEGTKAARARALERAEEAQQDRAVLLEQESGLSLERDEALTVVEAEREKWETVRAVEARIAVDVARLEGDERRLAERLQSLSDARARAVERLTTLEAEEASLRSELTEARGIRTEGDKETERLFEARTAAEATVRRHDDGLQEIAEALAVAERRVREARTCLLYTSPSPRDS